MEEGVDAGGRSRGRGGKKEDKKVKVGGVVWNRYIPYHAYICTEYIYIHSHKAAIPCQYVYLSRPSSQVVVSSVTYMGGSGVSVCDE